MGTGRQAMEDRRPISSTSLNTTLIFSFSLHRDESPAQENRLEERDPSQLLNTPLERIVDDPFISLRLS